MPKSVKLLLTENVEALGIVGDVVNVRNGYARNFLLPRSLATQPSEEKIKALAAKRAEAERMLAEQRASREQLTQKLQGVEVHLTRSCNDQGILYGGITQQEIAAALAEQGFGVKPREVRIPFAIKRVDTYDVHIKLDSDLDSVIKLWVMADRKLDLDRASEAAAAPAEEAPAKGEKPGAEGKRDGGKDKSAETTKGAEKGGAEKGDRGAEKKSKDAGREAGAKPDKKADKGGDEKKSKKKGE